MVDSPSSLPRWGIGLVFLLIAGLAIVDTLLDGKGRPRGWGWHGVFQGCLVLFIGGLMLLPLAWGDPTQPGQLLTIFIAGVYAVICRVSGHLLFEKGQEGGKDRKSWVPGAFARFTDKVASHPGYTVVIGVRLVVGAVVLCFALDEANVELIGPLSYADNYTSVATDILEGAAGLDLLWLGVLVACFSAFVFGAELSKFHKQSV